MQAFIPDYDCDLFISSARADSRGTAGEATHAADWVNELRQSLQSLIGQKLGRRDWGVVRGTADQSPTDFSSFRCATLLVVLTNDYLRDESCVKELDAFLSSTGQSKGSDRVFVVLADDIGRASWPVALQSHLAWDFLRPLGSHAVDPQAPRPRLGNQDKFYPVRLDDLSSELAVRLERLRHEVQGTPSADTPTVYLGTASPDVSELRDGMRRYLMQEGFRIEPHLWRPQETAALRAAVLNDMQNSQLLVQLLGTQPIPSVSSVSPGPMEVEVAEQAGVPILSWRDPRLDVATIADVEHRRLVEGKHVLAVGLEEFKRKVVEQVHAHAKKMAISSDQPLVVVAASEVDRTLAQQVGQLLGGKGLGIEIPDTAEFPWELYSNGKRGVGGLLIVYGACPAIWVRQQLWKYRKAMARLESRPPLCAVCHGPPEVKEPLRYDVPQMDMIDCRIQVTEEALSSFVDAVQRRCSQ